MKYLLPASWDFDECMLQYNIQQKRACDAEAEIERITAELNELKENLTGYMVIKPSACRNAAVFAERCGQLQGPDKWAIRSRGYCMNKSGEFEYEPRPSERNDDFINRCRWDTMQEAIDFYRSLQEVDKP